MPQRIMEFRDMKDVLDEAIEEMLRENPKITAPAFVLADKLVDLFCETSAPVGVVAVAMALILRHSLDYAEHELDAAKFKSNPCRSRRIH